MTHILLGGGGVLGSALLGELSRCRASVLRLRPEWSNPDFSSVTSAVRTALAAGPVTVVWAAGVGRIGAPRETLAVETARLSALLEGLVSCQPQEHGRLSVLLASSAGALHGGAGRELVTATTPLTPVTDYGAAKLEQEAVLERFVRRTGCTGLACRYSNLYGLAQDRLTPRGLVAVAVRATRFRQPMTVFVSPDNRRDYLYNADAATLSLQALRTGGPGFAIRYIADGQVRSVAEILATVGRVSGRKVPATFAERPETRLQPPVLRIAPDPSTAWHRRTPLEVAVHRMLRAPLTG